MRLIFTPYYFTNKYSFKSIIAIVLTHFNVLFWRILSFKFNVFYFLEAVDV